MADPVWTVIRTEYDIEEGPGDSVKVASLHWQSTLTEGDTVSTRYGKTADGQNRVYALPALQTVPEAVMVGWVQVALGDEEVASIETSLAASIAEMENPTRGFIEV